jgi:hypothetical protein
MVARLFAAGLIGRLLLRGQIIMTEGLEQDDSSSNRHLAPALCLSMIFSENRYTLFRIML